MKDAGGGGAEVADAVVDQMRLFKSMSGAQRLGFGRGVSSERLWPHYFFDRLDSRKSDVFIG
jgi:hypothetical protein